MTTNGHDTETSGTEISTELSRLAENIGNLLKTVWNSEERKHVESEVRVGLEQFTKQLATTLDELRSDEKVKKAKDAAVDAWMSVHGPQIVGEVRTGLAEGLRKLNEDLAKRAEPKPAHEAEPAKPPEATPVG